MSDDKISQQDVTEAIQAALGDPTVAWADIETKINGEVALRILWAVAVSIERGHAPVFVARVDFMLLCDQLAAALESTSENIRPAIEHLRERLQDAQQPLRAIVRRCTVLGLVVDISKLAGHSDHQLIAAFSWLHMCEQAMNEANRLGKTGRLNTPPPPPIIAGALESKPTLYSVDGGKLN